MSPGVNVVTHEVPEGSCGVAVSLAQRPGPLAFTARTRMR